MTEQLENHPTSGYVNVNPDDRNSIACESITHQRAMQVIEESRRQRVEQCRAEMEAVLNKHGCAIDVAMVVRAGSITPQISIVSKN